MSYKPTVSQLKKMTVAERKIEAMRQIKASFDLARNEGTLHKRSARSVA